MSQTNAVLIIDKNSELVQILGAFFSLIGYKALRASRTKEAVYKLENQKYSFVLLDPDLGTDKPDLIFQTLNTKSNLNHKTPFILIPKKMDTHLPYEALNHIYTIVQKPFTFPELLGVINK